MTTSGPTKRGGASKPATLLSIKRRCSVDRNGSEVVVVVLVGSGATAVAGD